MNTLKAFGIFIVLVIIILAYSSLYIVNEGERALVLRLGAIETHGKMERPVIKGPGLHIKIPFLNQVKIFDVRLQTLDIKSSRIVTAEQKDVIVDYYVKWRISNIPLFFTRTSG